MFKTNHKPHHSQDQIQLALRVKADGLELRGYEHAYKLMTLFQPTYRAGTRVGQVRVNLA
jgi:hypothetical protein